MEKSITFKDIEEKIYPMAIRSNTPMALCESDSYQIKDLDSLLFFKVEEKSGYAPE